MVWLAPSIFWRQNNEEAEIRGKEKLWKGQLCMRTYLKNRIKILIVPVLWILIRSDPDPTFAIKICISFASLYFEFVPCVLMTWDVGSGIKRSESYTEFYIKHVIMVPVPVTWWSRPVGADLKFFFKKKRFEILVTFKKHFKAFKQSSRRWGLKGNGRRHIQPPLPHQHKYGVPYLQLFS